MVREIVTGSYPFWWMYFVQDCKGKFQITGLQLCPFLSAHNFLLLWCLSSMYGSSGTAVPCQLALLLSRPHKWALSWSLPCLMRQSLPLKPPLPFCTNHNMGHMHRHSVSPHGKSLVCDFCPDWHSIFLEWGSYWLLVDWTCPSLSGLQPFSWFPHLWQRKPTLELFSRDCVHWWKESCSFPSWNLEMSFISLISC